MKPKTLAVAAGLAFVLVYLAALAILLTSCGPEEVFPDVYLYGEVDGATWGRVARASEHMPTSPWPCVREIHIRETGCSLRVRGETVTHAGCYWPDDRIIITRLEALHHELGHASAECALGHPDSAHASPWWPAVEGAGR